MCREENATESLAHRPCVGTRRAVDPIRPPPFAHPPKDFHDNPEESSKHQRFVVNPILAPERASVVTRHRGRITPPPPPLAPESDHAGMRPLGEHRTTLGAPDP